MALAGDRNPPRPFYGSYLESGATHLPLRFTNLFSFNPSYYHQNPSHESDHSTSSGANSSFHGRGLSFHQPAATMNKVGSFLSFETHQPCYSFGQSKGGFGGGSFRVLGDKSRLQMSGDGGGHQRAAAAGDRESAVKQQTSFSIKRPLMDLMEKPVINEIKPIFHKEENIQTLKKQCVSGGSSKKQPIKPKPSNSSNDTQSLAAKNRRERISERLKILQDLVPNGSKVDMVTMLEKAISYVKFLQLQVKVLATDEFWPESGGRLPDIAQVREAVDAILSCRRDGETSSN